MALLCLACRISQTAPHKVGPNKLGTRPFVPILALAIPIVCVVRTDPLRSRGEGRETLQGTRPSRTIALTGTHAVLDTHTGCEVCPSRELSIRPPRIMEASERAEQVSPIQLIYSFHRGAAFISHHTLQSRSKENFDRWHQPCRCTQMPMYPTSPDCPPHRYLPLSIRASVLYPTDISVIQSSMTKAAKRGQITGPNHLRL
jgi:hypothetical protein